jgi:hypothetical protein
MTKRFQKADRTIVCDGADGCGAWLVLAPFAALTLGTEVIPGHSLYACIMDAHIRSGHKLGTEEDANAHGVEVVW